MSPVQGTNNDFLVQKFLECISLKNVPLFDKSSFLRMDIVQTETRMGNVQLDKMYSLYLKECIVQRGYRLSLLQCSLIYAFDRDTHVIPSDDKDTTHKAPMTG